MGMGIPTLFVGPDGTAPDARATALGFGERRVTFDQLNDRVRRIAHWLTTDAAVRPGESVAVLANNGVEPIELLIAGLIGSVWIVPINTQLSPDEAAYVAADAGARVIFHDGSHRVLARNIASVRGIPRIEFGDDFDSEIADVTPGPLDLEAMPGGRMVYTSGTTGYPKGVKRHNPPTVSAALIGQRNSGLALGLNGAGTHLMTGPWYHAAVSGYALFDLFNGATVEMMARFDAALTLRQIDRLQVAHTHMVPTMFERLLRLPADERAAFDGSSLRLVLHGAAPVRAETKRAMIEWFGPEVLVEYWGSSEVGTVSLISAGEWLEHPGSVGRPVDGWSVTVRDDDGQPLRDGQVGTLFCASTSGERRFSYHGDADKTEAAHLGVEFTPGDLGWIDNGYIYLSGRASNMIISGGVNVYPAEVEAVLARHPAVLDVAVFGIPDDEWGERVHGAVSLVPPAEGSAVDSPADDRSGLIDEILGFCRQHLARYKCPRSLDVHDALPRRDDGKLAVRTLRDPYWQGRSRKI